MDFLHDCNCKYLYAVVAIAYNTYCYNVSEN